MNPKCRNPGSRDHQDAEGNAGGREAAGWLRWSRALHAGGNERISPPAQLLHAAQIDEPIVDAFPTTMEPRNAVCVFRYRSPARSGRTSSATATSTAIPSETCSGRRGRRAGRRQHSVTQNSRSRDVPMIASYSAMKMGEVPQPISSAFPELLRTAIATAATWAINALASPTPRTPTAEHDGERGVVGMDEETSR